MWEDCWDFIRKSEFSELTSSAKSGRAVIPKNEDCRAGGTMWRSPGALQRTVPSAFEQPCISDVEREITAPQNMSIS